MKKNCARYHEMCIDTTYRQVVEVASAVSLDVEYGKEQRDLVAGRCLNSDVAVDVDRVIVRPARTHNTTASSRKHLVTRCAQYTMQYNIT